MLRAIVLASLIAGLAALPNPVSGQEKKDPKAPAAMSADSAAKWLGILHDQRVQYDKNVNDVPLFELLQDLAKRHDLTFVILEETFKAEGLANIREAKPNLTATKFDGLTVHRFLSMILKSVDAAYLVRADHIEITTRTAALKEAGLEEAAAAAESSDDPNAGSKAAFRHGLPIVSVVVDEQPLDEVIAKLARDYDLNVVIHPEVRKAMKAMRVSERLLNVPADDALELLAALVEQPVVRKGNTFRIGLGGPAV